MNKPFVVISVTCVAMLSMTTVFAKDLIVRNGETGYVETEETGYTEAPKYTETDEQRFSVETTATIISAATEGSDTEERIVATRALWQHAADLGFTDWGTVKALEQLAGDDDPEVSSIALQALDDMDKYLRTQ